MYNAYGKSVYYKNPKFMYEPDGHKETFDLVGLFRIAKLMKYLSY